MAALDFNRGRRGLQSTEATTMWRNPVLGKELRLALRHGRSFLVLAVYVTALAAVIAFVYPRWEMHFYRPLWKPVPVSGAYIGPSPPMQLVLEQTSAVIGRRLFEAFTRAQFVLVLLLVPALTAPLLTVEKEKRTLESLLISGLTPYQIVLGKFVYSLFHVSLLILASVPLTAVSFMLGGVSPLELAAAYGLTFALAVGLTLMSLVVSAAVSRSHVATVIVYGLTAGGVAAYVLNSLLLVIVLAIVYVVLLGIASGLLLLLTEDRQHRRRTLFLTPVPSWQRWLPVIGLALLVSPAFIIWDVKLFYLWLTVLPVAVMLVWTLMVPPLVIAEVLVTRPIAPRVPLRHRWEAWIENRGSRRRTQTAGSKRRGELRPTFGVRPFISDKTNPVLARELRGSLFGRKEQFVRALYVATIGTELALIGVFGLTDRSLMLWPQLLRWYCVGNVVAVLAIGALLGALTFSMEREQRSLDLLLITPLSSHRLVFGKYAAACYFTGYLVVASLPVTGFSCVFGFVPPGAALLMTAGLVVWGVWAVAIGVCCSMTFPRARQAVGAALGVVLLLVGGSVLAEILAPSVLITSRFGFYLRYPALALLPVYVTNHFMTEFTRTLWLSSFLAADWQSLASYAYLVPLWETLACSIAVYLVILVPLISLAPWLFERRVRHTRT